MNKIIAIAINEYQDHSISNLNNCISDAEILIKTFTEEYQIDDVTFIADPEDTTGKHIYSTLNEHLINALDEDSIIILFAGHGIYNSQTTSTYWQPSDAQQDDPFTWFNISELINMIRVSPAKHISIISDSCFSGAIFDSPLRQGGISAYQNAKSREALTSGGIEPVHDGNDGGMSPFAHTLNALLLDNTLKELPFTVLANQVVLGFASDRKQTPRSGSISNVGHEGGSLILKRRIKNDKGQKQENSIKSLLNSLSNLQLIYSNDENELIDKLRPINDSKITAVLSQKYEEATIHRDNEKKLEAELRTKITNRLNTLFDKETQRLQSPVGDSIDEAYEKFVYKERIEEDIYNRIKNTKQALETKKDEPSEGSQLEYLTKNLSQLFGDEFGMRMQARVELSEIAKNDPKIDLDQTNPNKELWDNHRSLFITSLQTDILELLKALAVTISGAQNAELTHKKKELINYILEIHEIQMRSIFGSNMDDFDQLLKRKDIEVKLINWIRDLDISDD